MEFSDKNRNISRLMEMAYCTARDGCTFFFYLFFDTFLRFSSVPHSFYRPFVRSLVLTSDHLSIIFLLLVCKPCSHAPFIGAGFFFAHAEFLADVPFDPYVPWVFMGEEILLSLRMWTWGYDIFSPTRNVLSHFYVRRHTPKFWETVNR